MGLKWIDEITKNTIRTDKISRNKFTEFDIKLVQAIDTWAQAKNPQLDKQFSQIFRQAEYNKTSDYGWRGIAEKDPRIFEKAFKLAEHYKEILDE